MTCTATNLSSIRQTKPDQPSRRSFLRRSVGCSLGLAAAAWRVPCVHAASDETLKVALIGCGGRGTGAAAQALSTKGPVKLWAMADLFQDQIDKSLKSLHAGGQRYDREKDSGFRSQIDVAPERQFVGFDAYRKAIDCGVDLAILTTFPHFRPETFEYAVERGVHVFQEKPVAVDAPGIRRILEANKIAIRKNLKVSVGLQRHHNSIYQQVIPRIHDGALGDLILLRCYWNSSSSKGLGPRDEMSEMEFQLRNKYLFTWLIGDHIVEQHIHNIDVCNWIMRGHPVSANGMGGRQVRNGLENGEIYDHHFVEFTYEDGTKMYSQCRQMPKCWNFVGEAAVGRKGLAEIGQRKALIDSLGLQWESTRRTTNPYQVEHDVLFDAIRNDTPHNETEYGAISTMTAIMGRMATYSGQQIRWNEALASTLELRPDRYAFDATPPVVPNEQGVYPCATPGVTRVL